ncbi:hypothetical protein TWF569_011769 [Orbilia oligospora]|uniref:UBX domain-containing protein n=1 Tax=Orbilia oligospora TaxID=2813651 RepID=A0A7C8NIA1_ORBOL|nr:hypothetical protein TWF102_004440 [Orbilia oligospora]KAF3103752.1 hypothetical protein TWF706_004796 [Orbilia oligospora]KAF3110361.1 hypothetical protein TWF103_004649 [Orbilia oligospora]KAF3122514.1 hypothetical protein TWF594_002805 [Orbilia oligospora]KAF3127406.1 hypothetical protein TWF569_011769 [Orbilia oligospora]
MDNIREELLAQFVAITNTSSVNKAETYLRLTEWNLEQAIELFFANDGADLSSTVGGTSSSTSAAAPPPQPAATPAASTTHHQSSLAHQGRTSSDAISVDDDDDEDMETARAIAAASEPTTGNIGGISGGNVEVYEDDEAMARRLQEELYAEPGGSGSRNAGSSWREEDIDGVRAPMARTTETLVGPGDDHIRRLVEHRNRTAGRPQGRGPVGIFNQRVPDDPMAFGDSDTQVTPAQRRRALAQATNGASNVSSRASRLAELYTPPFEIMTRADFSSARDIGKERLKWLMVNIQDSTVFDSQVLNRDIWKDPAIRSTIQENFIFLQHANDSVDGIHYINLYLNASRYVTVDYPHIGIIDPRTGELLKSWSRVPDKNEFLMQLHEFLERYSLDPSVKMPVQQKPKEKSRGVEHMTEEEMMQLALQQSLGVGATQAENGESEDPDLLTRKEGKQKAVGEGDLINLDEDIADAPPAAPTPAEPSAAEPVSVFASIAKNKHHSEPPAGAPAVTRVQFRLPDGARVVRRFTLADSVERIFEYVKADLLPEQATKTGDEGLADKEFELKCLGKNLIDHLDVSIEEAGLKMATIMVDIES